MAAMSVRQRALTVDCEAAQLVGILSIPPVARSVGVLIVVGGPQYRVGSHRQFLLLSRRLAGAGIPVMRFDCRGMGDSSGAARSFEATVPDIAAAIDAFQAACPSLERVVLWGLCDGASACLLYWHATADARVAGLVLLNPWVLSEAAFARSQIRHYYAQRMLQRDFWMKLVRGRVDLAGTSRSLATILRSACATLAHRSAEAGYQSRMASAMAEFPGPVLLILSERDPTAQAFFEHCQSDAEWRGLLERANVEHYRLPDADHTFSSAAWRREVEELTLDWVNRSCATDRSDGDGAFLRDRHVSSGTRVDA